MERHEKESPEQKRRVASEESGASHHEHHGKHHHHHRPDKEAHHEHRAREEVAAVERPRMERAGEPAGEPARRTAEEELSRRAAVERRTEAPEKLCDACGRVHPQADQCQRISYEGQSFNVCGGCIPATNQNPADFLAGKKGTMTEEESWRYSK